jgi:hypothetical protein
MAAAAIFLILDYTTLHLLLGPPNADPPASTLPAQATEAPLGIAQTPDIIQLPDIVPSRDVAAIAMPIFPDAGQPLEVDTVQEVGTLQDALATVDLQTPPEEIREAASVADDATSSGTEAADAQIAPEPARSSTRLSVFPPDAKVYVDNHLLGTGPQVLSFVEDASAQEIRIEKVGFETTTFKLRHPAPRSLAKRLQRVETGRFYLRYNPASADVLVDGKLVVSSDGLNIIDRQLTVGSHTIIVREGEQETTKTITIEKDREWRGTITATP